MSNRFDSETVTNRVLMAGCFELLQEEFSLTDAEAIAGRLFIENSASDAGEYPPTSALKMLLATSVQALQQLELKLNERSN